MIRDSGRDAASMRKLFALVFGFGLGLVVMFLAFNVHVVRTDSDWHFVKKQKVQFADCYADIRNCDAQEWTRHWDIKCVPCVDAHLDVLISRVATPEVIAN